MSQSPISPEQLAALPAEAQAVIKTAIEYYERRIAALENELAEASGQRGHEVDRAAR